GAWRAPQRGEAVFFKCWGNPLEEMIGAPGKDAVDSRKRPRGLETRRDLPDRRPHHRADENHIPAALLAGKPAKPAELADCGPMMRVACDPLRIRPAANGEKHHATPALAHRVGHRHRQASAATDHRKPT